MVIADRLKALREQKDMSQGDIEKKTGLLRCYISRVENGHTVPAIETLEKMARALDVPMYQLFYEGENPPKLDLPKPATEGWGSNRRESRMLDQFRRVFARIHEADRNLLLAMARKASNMKVRLIRKRSKSHYKKSPGRSTT
jgi:transcriptional regulator with XRE-family HTH domain